MTLFPREPLPENPRTIFMGTPEFAVPALKALVKKGYDIQAVVTQPDRPRGRGRKIAASPVKLAAGRYDIPTLQPEKASDEDFCRTIRDIAPDLIIVVAFGQILKKRFLTIPKCGAINIHASLLPRYRGAAPIQWTILNNDARTGLTIMRMEEGLDTGPVLFQEEIPVIPNETSGQLHDRLAVMAGDFITKFMALVANKQIREQPQEHSASSYAPKIDRNMSLIDWEKDARSISALIRAFDPVPGAYTTLGDKKIKLFSPVVLDETRADNVPGRVLTEGRQGFRVETGKGLLEIREIQYPGKRRLPARDFLRGFSVPEGAILGKTEDMELKGQDIRHRV